MRGSAAFRASVTPGGALAGPWTRNLLWSRARAVPSLDLRFAENKSLTDATTGQNLVTFTRASSGTYVDSQGVIRTATTNLLLRSEEPSSATWAKDFTVATADQATAPNGTLTADKVAEDSTTNFHAISQYVTGFASGAVASLSIYAKAAGRTKFRIQTDSTGGTGTADFDLSTATATSGTGVFSASSIQAVGDGWYRCSVRCTTSGAGAIGLKVILAQTNYGTAYTGDGTSGLLLWGAQLEQSSTVGEYIPTTSTINSAPRFDHNPTTGESLGLLVEESRTNLLLQSEDFLTTWTVHDGLTRTANQAVSPSGLTNADLFTGNGVSIGYIEQPTASSNQFVSGTTYTFSIYLRKANTSTCITLLFGSTFNSGGSNPVATWNLDTGVPSFSNGATGSMTPVGNGWYRCVVTDTATQTETKNQQWLRMPSASGDVYAWGAQLEAASFPTSYIPTTTATVTRSADVASITGANFSSWYRQDEGTVFVDAAGVSNLGGATRRYCEIKDNASSERVILGYSAINNNRFLVVDNSSTVADITATSSPTAKAAGAYKVNSFQLATNGTLGTEDGVGTVPTPDQMFIGSQEGSSANTFLNGTIRRLTYFPTRLPNSTLQQITQ